MKTFCKSILLILAHGITLFLAATLAALVALILLKFKIGQVILYDLTGGWVDWSVVLFANFSAFFCCRAIANKINCLSALRYLGYCIIIIQAVSLVLNLKYDAGFSKIVINLINAVFGIAFIKTWKS